jgi:hypothetical protein
MLSNNRGTNLGKKKKNLPNQNWSLQNKILKKFLNYGAVETAIATTNSSPAQLRVYAGHSS